MQSEQLETTARAEIPFYRDERVLRIAAQVISAIAVIGFLIWVVINFISAAQSRNLALNFNFLNNPAGFPISDPPIAYDASMSFARAFLVGLLNTLRVSVLGVVVATILGVFIALARLSSNWLFSKLALAYIEFHRNIPLLVLLFLWYFSVFAQMPSLENSIVLPGPIYLNQRGVYFAWPRLNESGTIFAVMATLGVLLAIVAFFYLRRRRAITGQRTYYTWVSLGLLLAFPAIGWFASGGSPFHIDVPEITGFNVQGGLRFTPEFAGLFVGLTMYTAAFIAEVVRGGIQAVDKGQVEAARAVGLKQGQVLSLVVFPQALRVITPPMISQYLNLTKNSSLALAIGYQELFSVGKIAINQAGRAVPVFAMVMGTYLALSLLTSLVLNIYNRRIQFVTH